MNVIMSTAQRAATRFSAERAFQLCREVEYMEAHGTANNNASATIRELAETLVYCDRHSEAVFDQIMERDLMNTFERITTNAETATSIKMHILECICIVLQNLSRVSSTYFLCSNNHINRIIAVGFDEGDDELVSMYVSFLKTMALRLNRDTVQFFFDADTRAFPLFDKAVKLLSSGDPMVRTAARQVVVSVTQLEDGDVAAFLGEALREVFELVIDSIASQLSTVSSMGPALPLSTSDAHALRNSIEDIADDLYYLNDLCSALQQGATRVMVDIAEERLLRPLLRCVTVSSCHDEQMGDRSAIEDHRFQDVSASMGLAFLSRWIDLNTVLLLRERVQQLYCAAADSVLVSLLLSDRVELHGSVVLLLSVLYTEEEELTTSNKYEAIPVQEWKGDATYSSFVQGVLGDTAVPPHPRVGHLPALLASLFQQIKHHSKSSPRALYLTLVELRKILQRLSDSEPILKRWCAHTLEAFRGCLAELVTESYAALLVSNETPSSSEDDTCSSARVFAGGLRLSDEYEIAYLVLKAALDEADECLPTISIGFDAKDITGWWLPSTAITDSEMQQGIGSAVPLARRAAYTPDEFIRAINVKWVLVHRFFSSLGNGSRDIREAIPRFSPGNGLFIEAGNSGIRCELVTLWYADSVPAATRVSVSPGTVMFLVVAGDALLCASWRRNAQGVEERTQLMVLDMAFVDALVLMENSCRVAVRHLYPGQEMEMHIVTCCSGEAAQASVESIHAAASRVRLKGALSCRKLLAPF